MTETFDNLKVEVTTKELEASKAIREAKSVFDAKAQEIGGNRHLTAEGRSAAYDELRAELEAELSEKLAKLREEHAQASQKVNEAAREILVKSAHEKPSDAEIELFERDLHELKMDLALAPRYSSAIQKINEFEAKYQEGYYAEKMLKELPTFIDTVKTLAENKNEAIAVLTRLKNTIRDRAKTDEQKKAEQYLQYASNPQFLSRASTDYRLLNELFGSATAYKLTK